MTRFCAYNLLRYQVSVYRTIGPLVFGMPIKTLGSLGKIRVGRVTGNTHIIFFGLMLETMQIFVGHFGKNA